MENLAKLYTKCASTVRKNLAAEPPRCPRGFHVARATVLTFFATTTATGMSFVAEQHHYHHHHFVGG
uniref:Uncharacterized protein n=1 Tax=Trichogramma kaykai TaxID=54128 RepID=A0ABD2X4S2_9HYME